MLRRLLAVLISLTVGSLLLPALSIALPPSPELEQWNEGPPPVRMPGEAVADFLARWRAWRKAQQDRIEWNCYNYGVNSKTTQGGDAVRAHPGKGIAWPNIGANLTAAQWCDKCRARAKKDGLNDVAWNPGDPIPAPPPGANLVALGAKAGFKSDTVGAGDYHWWRLNGDGSWSHKRGGTKAKTTYTDGTGAEKPLTDPRQAAQRDGYDLCGFMSVPKGAALNVGPLAAAPTCTPRDGAVLVRAVGPSGLPDPQKVLTLSEQSQLASRLPAFTPSNQVPDPHWVEPPAGQLAGWVVAAGPDGAGSIPPYLRAYQGRLEVTVADTVGPAFYPDTYGVEAFLFQTVLYQLRDFCATEDGPVELTPCECSDEATGGIPTGTLLALFQAQPVPEGLELHWQITDPAEFVSIELERSGSADGPWARAAVERRDQGEIAIALDRDVVSGRTYFYHIVASRPDGHILVFGPLAVTAGATIPGDALESVAPNPGHGPVRIGFALQRQSHVRLSVLDLQGREIALLAHGPAGPGRLFASWSGETAHGDAPAGVYFACLEVAGRKMTKQFILTR